MNGYVSPTTAGFTVAASAAIIFNMLLTWAKETYPSLNAAMKALLGHHWITHGVAVVLVFFILGLAMSRWPHVRRLRGSLLAAKIALATIIGGVGIAGYFLIDVHLF